jgi:hypothetical protein
VNEGQNAMGMVSAVCGILAVLGHGCCCVPIVSSIAPFLVIALETAAIVCGVLARQQAAAKGETDGRAMIGLVSGGLAILMTLAYVLLMGSAVVAYLALVLGLAVAGN